MADTSPSRWFAQTFRTPAAPFRLFCFAGAGGSASAYRLWGPALAPAVDLCAVELPGHWTRMEEPLLTRFHEVIEGVGPHVAALTDRPFAIFGFSLGSLLAFHTTRWLRRHGHPAPQCLFVAGRAAPEFAAAHGEAKISTLPDAQFIDKMQTVYGGIPAAVLREPELLKLTLPVLRADMTVLDDHTCPEEPPLAVPLHISGGLDDAHLTDAKLQAWRAHTTGPADITMFPGSHHFLDPSRAAVLAYVRARLGV